MSPFRTPANPANPANRAIAAFALASITTLALLAGVAHQADRAYADEQVAQGGAPAVQQVVVVGARGARS